MKVLMCNTLDEAGGAARAAVRLLRGVRTCGVEASLLVQFKTGGNSNVICHTNPFRKLARRLKVFLGVLPVRLYPNRPVNNFSPALLPDNKQSEIAKINPDIVHLHWLGAGFLRVETLPKLNKPLVWTLHDSWAFTGGCHVPFECTRYRQCCGKCPVLGSSRGKDLSRWTWRRKAKAWRELNLTVVTPSRWLAECARSSSLFRNFTVKMIPNGLDTRIFRPQDKIQARKALGLPYDRKVILFGAVRGASDPNKGFHLLQPALQAIGKGSADKLALVFSSFDRFGQHDLGMPEVNLGSVNDDRILATIYSAADVFVAPSLLENLPNTVMESMACGTPCVAFRQGGVSDLIDHEISGYLARSYEPDDLARGIAWVIEDRNRQAALSLRARQKIECGFSLDAMSKRYAALYWETLK